MSLAHTGMPFVPVPYPCLTRPSEQTLVTGRASTWIVPWGGIRGGSVGGLLTTSVGEHFVDTDMREADGTASASGLWEGRVS